MTLGTFILKNALRTINGLPSPHQMGRGGRASRCHVRDGIAPIAVTRAATDGAG